MVIQTSRREPSSATNAASDSRADRGVFVIGPLAETYAWLGRELPVQRGADVVTVSDIRRRLEVFGFDCPLHYDEEVARKYGYRTVVAPATMVRTWAMPAYWCPGDPEPSVDERPKELAMAVTRIPAPGPRAVVTEVSTDYLEPVYPGDQISSVTKLTGITEKRLRIGDGVFLTIETAYRKEDGEVVAVERLTLFRYSPVEGAYA